MKNWNVLSSKRFWICVIASLPVAPAIAYMAQRLPYGAEMLKISKRVEKAAAEEFGNDATAKLQPIIKRDAALLTRGNETLSELFGRANVAVLGRTDMASSAVSCLIQSLLP